MPNSWRNLIIPVAVVVALAFAGAGLALLAVRGNTPPGIEVILPTPSPTPVAQAYISGAVASPGVYTIDAGARIADLIQAAGGPTSHADLDRLNLAQRIADEVHVHVPTAGESLPSLPNAPLSMVNVNAANSEELQTLRGIGPVLAQAIVEYREANGPFLRLEDLLLTPGIGPATLEGLQTQATVR